MTRLRLPLTSRLAAIVNIGLIAALQPDALTAGENQMGPAPSRLVMTELNLLRLRVQRTLGHESHDEALPLLEKLISALTDERDRAVKGHRQAATTLEEIEKLKHELAQAHLKYGEISRRLSHNRPAADSHRPEHGSIHGGLPLTFNLKEPSPPGSTRIVEPSEAILVQRALPLATNEKKDAADRWAVPLASVEAFRPVDETDVMKHQARVQIKLGNENDALDMLETLAAALRERRDRLAKGHGQQADRLARLTRLQDGLGRAHLDCGLLGQVIQARTEVARVAAEAAAGRATQADLAAARDQLAAAEARMAAQGILCGR